MSFFPPTNVSNQSNKNIWSLCFVLLALGLTVMAWWQPTLPAKVAVPGWAFFVLTSGLMVWLGHLAWNQTNALSDDSHLGTDHHRLLDELVCAAEAKNFYDHDLDLDNFLVEFNAVFLVEFNAVASLSDAESHP